MDRRDIYLRQVAKYGIFVLSVFVLYILQSAPGFLCIFGIKPVLILPFCIALSMLDESWQAGIVYIVGGLLTDLSSGRIVGFFTILLLLCCFAGIISVKFFFKPNRRNIYIFSLLCMTVMFTIDFYVSYMFGGYSGRLFFYLKNVILLSAYSAVFTTLFYHFIDYISLRFIRFDAR